MNVAERLAQYENRGFDRATASINVLLEETLQALFKKYPNTFVFFGGASLAIFYGSTRHSGDLDLLTCFGSPPGLDELRGTLQRPLTEICELLGFASPAIEPLDSSGDVKKLAVKSGNNALFTIDLTNISTVIRTELVEFTIPSGSGPTTKITVPSKDFQLLLKLEAFLTRRFVKARDAFDIKLLLDSGAGLHESLRDHLIDVLRARRLKTPNSLPPESSRSMLAPAK